MCVCVCMFLFILIFLFCCLFARRKKKCFLLLVLLSGGIISYHSPCSQSRPMMFTVFNFVCVFFPPFFEQRCLEIEIMTDKGAYNQEKKGELSILIVKHHSIVKLGKCKNNISKIKFYIYCFLLFSIYFCCCSCAINLSIFWRLQTYEVIYNFLFSTCFPFIEHRVIREIQLYVCGVTVSTYNFMAYIDKAIWWNIC